jgi:hypothetical protein
LERWEQYEVWAIQGGENARWEMVAAFSEFEVASAVARKRQRNVRLIHAIYEGNKLIEKHILADLGQIREAS